MSQLIQVCGLPRSGTGFISTMFSLAPSCIGLHEEAATNIKWRDTIAELLTKYDFVADCTTYGYFPNGGHKESIKVYLNRDVEKCCKSCEATWGMPMSREAVYSMKAMADQWAVDNEALIINCDMLFDVETLKLIWEYCLDGVEFPQEKVSRLVTMNIQRQDPRKVFSMENSLRVIAEVM